MGSEKPILGASKPDLVAVILDRYCAQQLALALAWALGTTGGGKMTKGGGYPVVVKDHEPGKKTVEHDPGKKKPVDETVGTGAPKLASALKIVGAPEPSAEKSRAKGGKKPSGKKSAGKK
jgi:hypothetical protein